MRKRVLSVLENDMYIRNWFASGAMNDLLADESIELGVLLGDAVCQLDGVVPQDKIVGTYRRDFKNIGLVYSVNKMACKVFGDRSTTFKIKADLGWFSPSTELDERVGAWLAQDGIERTNAGVCFPWSPAEVVDQARAFKPDLVLFPFTGVESTGYELVQAEIAPVAFLTNGWDNLSSKGLLVNRPAYISAIGPGSQGEAVRIQGVDPARVVPLGCARYDAYWHYMRSPWGEVPRSYVVFAGSSETAHCEQYLLGKVREALPREIALMYRPHPWMKSAPPSWRPEDLPNTILDPCLAPFWGRGDIGEGSGAESRPYPDLAALARLLWGAKFVISPMSSLILEAAIVGTPALVLACPVPSPGIGPDTLAAFEHFAGYERIPGWAVAHEVEQIEGCIDFLLALDGEWDVVSKWREKVFSQYLYYADLESYGKRLHDFVLAAVG